MDFPGRYNLWPAAHRICFSGWCRPDAGRSAEGPGKLNWDRWAIFLVTSLLVSISPGPAVLMVLAQGLTRGFRRSLYASAGIVAGDGIYFTLSALGLGAVLAASSDLFLILKWGGAAYLVFLGLTAIFRAPRPVSEQPAGEARAWRVFINGMVVELSNPKCLLFFVVVLPQFIDTRGDIVRQVLVLGATNMIGEIVVLAAYGAFAGRFHRVATQPRFAKLAARLSGSCLVTAGVLTAAARVA